MAQVQLDLALGLEAFQSKVAAAEGMLLRLKSKTDAGVSLKAFLDTSSLQTQLQAAQKALSSGTTTIKVGTDFYKTGSQYAISATKLKTQVIDPIQQKVAGDRKYTIKIGTELTFNQDSLKQIDQIVAKAKASLEGVQRSTAATRQQLNKLTLTPAQDGLDAAGVRRLQKAAADAGIKTSATGATELRKELRDAFSKASDDAIEGLARGLTSKSSTVIDASTKTGKDLIKALKRSLGIASPSKETRKLGEASADGFGQGFVGGMVDWERQMARAIRQSIGNAFQQGLSRDAAARGALADMGRDAAQVISTSLGKALKQGLASSVAPALKGGLLGATGGMATGGLVGGLGSAGSAIKQAVTPSMLTFGYGSVPQKLGMLGHGAASLASGGASDAFNTFLQNSLDSVVQAAMSTGGQGALVGAAGVAGVAGVAGLARGATGSLIGQAIDSVKNRILGQGAQQATQQAEQLDAGGNALASAAPDPQAARAIERSMQRFEVKLTDAQYNLLEYALALDNIDTGTFGEKWSQLGGALSKRMELSAEQLSALASEIDTNPVLDDIDSYGDELGKSATRIAANIKAKFADLTRQLNESGGRSAAGLTAASISRDLMSGALQDSAALAQAGSTSGAVTAPVENANSMFGALREGTATVAKALASFARELTPGRIQERILEIAWNMDQAAQEFAEAKRNTQVLAGKIRNTWDAFSNDVRPHLLPPEPVAGTGLVRQQRLQLGDVVGRTGFGFSGQAYGVEGGLIGPADIDQGRGYLEQTRRALEPVAGRPGEWRIVDEVNGVWQRIKTNSELAEERMALIAQSMTAAGDRFNRTWTDRDGIGAFNPFDQAFYRPTRPPQQPPSGGDGSYGGNRFGRPDPAGALAMRNVPVELFASFREAERLLALVEQRLGAVGRAFDTLKVKSQIQADQEVRKLSVSLRAVELAFQKGEVSASDMRAAVYGMQREMAGLDAQTAEVQNLARAFENLGGMATQAREAIERQRNLDVEFIQDATRNPDGSLSRDGRRAGNLRDIQQLDYANELVRGMQSSAGFGGFRGREIGNDTLIKALQRTNLKEYINQFEELSQGILQTSRNTRVYGQVQKALSDELENAARAYRVLSGEASAGDRVIQLSRNIWGTLLDDFQNLVPQLVVFAFTYNLVLQRVGQLPGAIVQSAAAFDRLERSISSYLSATRSIGDASAEIEKLKQVSLDLGVSFENAGKSYMAFAAATQGTSLEGREIDITRTIATAGRNQGLSGEQISNATRALTQILSKGTVQAEELRGQLAEALPGALQVAARGFGVTTSQLLKMVEAGRLAGDEFVGVFIDQLKSEGADVNVLGSSFASVSEQLAVSLQALGAAAGQTILPGLTAILQATNAIVKAALPVGDFIVPALIAIGAEILRLTVLKKSWGGVWKEVMATVISGLNAAKASVSGFSLSVAGMKASLAGAKTAAVALGKALGPFLAISAAFEVITTSIRFAKGELGQFADELARVKKEVDKPQRNDGFWSTGFRQLIGYTDVEGQFGSLQSAMQARETAKIVTDTSEEYLKNQKEVLQVQEQLREEERKLSLLRKQLARESGPLGNQDEAGRIRREIERIEKFLGDQKRGGFISPASAMRDIATIQSQYQALEAILAKGDVSPLERRVLEGALEKVREAFWKTQLAYKDLKDEFKNPVTIAGLEQEIKSAEERIKSLDLTRPDDVQMLYEEREAVVALKNETELIAAAYEPFSTAVSAARRELELVTLETQNQNRALEIQIRLAETRRRTAELELDLLSKQYDVIKKQAEATTQTGSLFEVPSMQLDGERQGVVANYEAENAQITKRRDLNVSANKVAQLQLLIQNAQLNVEYRRLEVQRLEVEQRRRGLELTLQQLEAANRGSSLEAEQARARIENLKRQSELLVEAGNILGQQSRALEIVSGELRSQLEIQDEILRTQQKISDIAYELGITENDLKRARKDTQDQIDEQERKLKKIEQASETLTKKEEERSKVLAKQVELIDQYLDAQRSIASGGFFEGAAAESLTGRASDQEILSYALQRQQLQDQIEESTRRIQRAEVDLQNKRLSVELEILKLRRQQIAAELSMFKGTAAFHARTPAEQQAYLQDFDRRFAKIDESIGAAESSLDSTRAASEAIVGLSAQERNLARVRNAVGLGKVIDEFTFLGRTLTGLKQSLLEFRSTASKAFSNAITNGKSASDAIADAGQAFAGSIMTTLIDEAILKPMEANLFSGLKMLFPDLLKAEENPLVTSTELNTTATTELTGSINDLNNTIKGLSLAPGGAGVGNGQASSGIGNQFLSLLGAESGYEDIAGLQPLPLQKMLQQIGRPLTVLYKRIEEAKNSVYPYSRREVKEMLAPNPARNETIINRARAVERARQSDPIEAQWKERQNRWNSNPRSKPGSASLETLSGVARQISADAFRGLQGMNGAIYGILGDISDYLNEGQLEVLRKGIKEQLDQGVSPSVIKREVTGGNIRTGRANIEGAVRLLVDELSGAGAKPFDDRFFNQLQNQPLITPGVESQFEGAMLPGQGFDISKLTREYQSVASASIQAIPVVPFQELEQGTQQLNEAITGGAAAINQTKTAAANTPSAFNQLNSTLGSVIGVLGGIGVGIAGAQQMQQGGTYNTLMGLAGIFGGISSIAGSFNSLGGMFGGGGAGPARLAQGIDVPLSQMPIGMRASGGPVRARRPYVVGEKGMELFIPSSDGAIVPNHRLQGAAQLAENAMALSSTSNGSGGDEDSSLFLQNQQAMAGVVTAQQQAQQEMALSQAAAMPARLEFSYQSEVINNVEYVSKEQFQKGMADAAERGRSLTFRSLQNSVAARRRIGI